MEMPFTAGWGLLHLGLLPLIFLVLGLAALKNNSCSGAMIFGGLLAYWIVSSINLLGFEWWACGSVVNLLVVAIPIGFFGRLLGIG